MNRNKIREIAGILRSPVEMNQMNVTRLQTLVRDLADAITEGELPSMRVPEARREELRETSASLIEAYSNGRISENELRERVLRGLERAFEDGVALGRRMGG